MLFPTETVYGIGANALNDEVRILRPEKITKEDIERVISHVEIDKYGVDLAVIEGMPPEGLGLAIMNRLI